MLTHRHVLLVKDSVILTLTQQLKTGEHRIEDDPSLREAASKDNRLPTDHVKDAAGPYGIQSKGGCEARLSRAACHAQTSTENTALERGITRLCAKTKRWTAGLARWGLQRTATSKGR